jgi:hypothetical protein
MITPIAHRHLHSTCQWIDGNEVASINLRAEAKRLHLSYPLRVGDREWRDVTDTIPSSICLVVSAAAVPISSALDLAALIADGA